MIYIMGLYRFLGNGSVILIWALPYERSLKHGVTCTTAREPWEPSAVDYYVCNLYILSLWDFYYLPTIYQLFAIDY